MPQQKPIVCVMWLGKTVVLQEYLSYDIPEHDTTGILLNCELLHDIAWVDKISMVAGW